MSLSFRDKSRMVEESMVKPRFRNRESLISEAVVRNALDVISTPDRRPEERLPTWTKAINSILKTVDSNRLRDCSDEIR